MSGISQALIDSVKDEIEAAKKQIVQAHAEEVKGLVQRRFDAKLKELGLTKDFAHLVELHTQIGVLEKEHTELGKMIQVKLLGHDSYLYGSDPLNRKIKVDWINHYADAAKVTAGLQTPWAKALRELESLKEGLLRRILLAGAPGKVRTELAAIMTELKALVEAAK